MGAGSFIGLLLLTNDTYDPYMYAACMSVLINTTKLPGKVLHLLTLFGDESAFEGLVVEEDLCPRRGATVFPVPWSNCVPCTGGNLTSRRLQPPEPSPKRAAPPGATLAPGTGVRGTQHDTPSTGDAAVENVSEDFKLDLGCGLLLLASVELLGVTAPAVGSRPETRRCCTNVS